jgi:ribosomal protein S14
MSLTQLLKNKKRRKLYGQMELKYLSYDYIIKNKKVDYKIRSLVLTQKILKLRRAKKTEIVNYCIVTKSPRKVFKNLKCSRQYLKKAVTLGI